MTNQELATQLQTLINQRLEKQRTILPTYRLPLTKEQVVDYLTAYYEAEVRTKGGVYDSEKNQAYIESVANWLTIPTKKRGLILYGTVGSGKSTMLRSICQMIRTIKQSYKDIGTAYFFDMDSAQRQRCKEWERVNEPDYLIANDVVRDNGKLQKALSSKFVALDDIGVEPLHKNDFGTVSMPIADVIYNCYDYNTPLIITTNLNDAQIKERYGARVADRLTEFCNRISYTNLSYRANK